MTEEQNSFNMHSQLENVPNIILKPGTTVSFMELESKQCILFLDYSLIKLEGEYLSTNRIGKLLLRKLYLS